MKVIHITKTKKINEIPLDAVVTKTRHSIKNGKVTHEGWVVGGNHTDKEHQYYLMFTVAEAKEFHAWLTDMIPRFSSSTLNQHIQEEC